jgi:hypothetical protein
MDPSSSLTQAKDTTECKNLAYLFVNIISHFVLCMEYVQINAFFFRDHFFILLEGEATGRLLRYDPPSKTTFVVLEGLAFPNGVQLSRDQSFILFTETTNCRYFQQLIVLSTIVQNKVINYDIIIFMALHVIG